MKTTTARYSIRIPSEHNLSYTSLMGYLTEIAQAAGGYELQEAKGGWLSPTDGIVHEPVIALSVLTFTQEARVAVRLILERLIVDQLTQGKQEAVLADLGEGPALYDQDDIRELTWEAA